jgi:hypothetical protein
MVQSCHHSRGSGQPFIEVNENDDPAIEEISKGRPSWPNVGCIAVEDDLMVVKLK